MCTIPLLGLGLAASTWAQEPDVAIQLRTKDQALLNAFPVGNCAAWEQETAPDFVYVAEDSNVLDRATLLRLLVPTPPYDTLPLALRDHRVQVVGDVAIVVYHADEQGVHLGSKLTGQYVTTETWQRLGGEWKLRSVHTNAVPSNPPAVQLSAEQLDEVVGTYAAESVVYTVRREGDRLFAKPSDGEEKEWKAETRDTFFVPGNARRRAVFRRNAASKVTGFSWRNENRSTVYTRTN